MFTMAHGIVGDTTCATVCVCVCESFSFAPIKTIRFYTVTQLFKTKMWTKPKIIVDEVIIARNSNRIELDAVNIARSHRWICRHLQFLFIRIDIGRLTIAGARHDERKRNLPPSIQHWVHSKVWIVFFFYFIKLNVQHFPVSQCSFSFLFWILPLVDSATPQLHRQI